VTRWRTTWESANDILILCSFLENIPLLDLMSMIRLVRPLFQVSHFLKTSIYKYMTESDRETFANLLILSMLNVS
jgi:hypothetical protein